MKTVAVIVAGGQGRRIKGDLPKQFMLLGDRPIVAHTLDKFERCDVVDEVVLVAPEQYVGYCSQAVVDKFRLAKVRKIVCGGGKRQDSVRLGLEACPAGTSVAVIHDAVRPFISPERISAAVKLCKKKKAVVLAVPPKDTIKRGEDGLIVTTLDRGKLWLIQTPQVFDYELILNAHEKAKEEGFVGTDDSVLVERLGKDVAILEGDYANVKITTAEDLAIAETLIRLTREEDPPGR